MQIIIFVPTPSN